MVSGEYEHNVGCGMRPAPTGALGRELDVGSGRERLGVKLGRECCNSTSVVDTQPTSLYSWKLCSTYLVRYSSESIYLSQIESVQFTFSSQEHLFNEIPT